MKTIISGIDKISTKNELFLKRFSDFEYRTITNTTALINALEECDIFWFRLNHKLTKEIIQKANCKYIVCAVTGLDHIDLESCKQKNTVVVSLFSESEFLKEIRATAEHTLGLLLSLIRKLNEAALHTQKGNWNRNLFLGNELYLKKAGIYGLGRLGKIVASYYHALGMDVYFYDIDKSIEESKYKRVESPEELCKVVDILSIHLPLDDSTKNCIDIRVLQNLPANAIVVNTSRGGVMNETDMLQLLQNERIGGYATDVLKGEPNIKSHPLIIYSKENSNILITPHIGGYTMESIEKTERFVLDKLFTLINQES